MRGRKTTIRWRDGRVLIGVAALALLAVVAQGVVRQVNCAPAQLSPTNCTFSLRNFLYNIYQGY